MISTVDLYKEIGIHEDIIKKDKVSDDEYKKGSLKLAILQLKLLHNLRTNMVLVMDKLGVKKVKPATKDGDEKEAKE